MTIYRSFLFLCLVFDLSLASPKQLCVSALTKPSEKYQNYMELQKIEIEGLDFQIVEKFVGSSVTVIAPHGGRIEFGTSEIARSIAGSTLNLYLFEGLKSSNNFNLHITSDHFDEPRALALMERSLHGISIHGFKDDGTELVAIGGADASLGERLARVLTKMGISVEFPSVRFQGQSSRNVVNRAREQGVQLEISSGLRSHLLENSDRLLQFSRAIRSVFAASH